VGSIYVNRILHPDPSKVARERKEIKIHGSPLESFGVCQNLLGKFCVLPTSKKLCKVKKEFISNSLA
jgi:hypothetical protein